MSMTVTEARRQLDQLGHKIAEVKPSAIELNRLLTMSLALGGRLGSEQLTKLITIFQQGRIAAETFYRSVMMIYTATGPVGWTLGLGGVALGTVMLADMAEIRRPRY